MKRIQKHLNESIKINAMHVGARPYEKMKKSYDLLSTLIKGNDLNMDPRFEISITSFQDNPEKAYLTIDILRHKDSSPAPTVRISTNANMGSECTFEIEAFVSTRTVFSKKIKGHMFKEITDAEIFKILSWSPVKTTIKEACDKMRSDWLKLRNAEANYYKGMKNPGN